MTTGTCTPGLFYFTEACAAFGRDYNKLCCSWSCLH